MRATRHAYLTRVFKIVPRQIIFFHAELPVSRSAHTNGEITVTVYFCSSGVISVPVSRCERLVEIVCARIEVGGCCCLKQTFKATRKNMDHKFKAIEQSQETHRDISPNMDGDTDTQTDRQTGGWTDRQTQTQTHTDRHTNRKSRTISKLIVSSGIASPKQDAALSLRCTTFTIVSLTSSKLNTAFCCVGFVRLNKEKHRRGIWLAVHSKYDSSITSSHRDSHGLAIGNQTASHIITRRRRLFFLPTIGASSP